jgi:hypothetical protein
MSLDRPCCLVSRGSRFVRQGCRGDTVWLLWWRGMAGRRSKRRKGYPSPAGCFLKFRFRPFFEVYTHRPGRARAEGRLRLGFAPLTLSSSLLLLPVGCIGCEWFPRVFRVKSLSTNPQSWDAGRSFRYQNHDVHQRRGRRRERESSKNKLKISR